MCERKLFAIVSLTIDLCQRKNARANTRPNTLMVLEQSETGLSRNFQLSVILSISNNSGACTDVV